VKRKLSQARVLAHLRLVLYKAVLVLKAMGSHKIFVFSIAVLSLMAAQPASQFPSLRSSSSTTSEQNSSKASFALKGTDLELPDGEIKVSVEELLWNNDTLSEMEGVMEFPLEEEPENTTLAGDMDDDPGASAEDLTRFYGWWSGWYGGGQNSQTGTRKICRHGTFIKTLRVVTSSTFSDPGFIRVESAVCSNGKDLGSDGGSGFGDGTWFISHKGFRQIAIFADSSVHGLCLQGKCVGRFGPARRVRCRVGSLLAGYQVRFDNRIRALKFFCRRIRRY